MKKHLDDITEVTDVKTLKKIIKDLPDDAPLPNPFKTKIVSYKDLDRVEEMLAVPDESLNAQCDTCSDIYDCVTDKLKDVEGTILDQPLKFIADRYMWANNLQNPVPAANDRGLVEYEPGELEWGMPFPYPHALDIERSNYDIMIDTIVDCERQKREKRMEEDLEDMKLYLKTMMEFNLQAGMHRDAVVMCTLVENNKKRD